VVVVYIGDVDVRSALHHSGVVVCCHHGGAFSVAFRFRVFLPDSRLLGLLLLLLLLLRLLLVLLSLRLVLALLRVCVLLILSH